MRNRIRLTESQLHRVIKESVKSVLNEITANGVELRGKNPDSWDYLGYLRKYRADDANDAYFRRKNDAHNFSQQAGDAYKNGDYEQATNCRTKQYIAQNDVDKYDEKYHKNNQAAYRNFKNANDLRNSQ